jgi:SAM-dependent methyltransferase
VGDTASVRHYGQQFDRVAHAYDRHRADYPDALVDAACAAAGVRAGDRVLEVGCGTGQLTAALAVRGLQVVAVDPGARMIERARARAGGGAVEFVCGRFEDVALPREHFAAVFSASAFHWVDPAVGWITQHELAVAEVAAQFGDVQSLWWAAGFDWTAERFDAHLRTTSLSFRLGPERTDALRTRMDRLLARFGGRIRLPALVVAVIARRSAAS